MKVPVPTLIVMSALVAIAAQPYRAQRVNAGKVIPSAEAQAHVGEDCIVELSVRSSKNSTDRECDFLDSEEDYYDANNVAIVIDHAHAAAFRDAGIENPAAYYFGKQIRVTGTLIHEAHQVRIRVTDPSAIEVVKRPPPEMSSAFVQAAPPVA